MVLPNIKNLVALVTGGSSGLGKATAELFLKMGYKKVVIFDLPTSQGKIVADQLGPNCYFIPGDVTCEGDVNKIVEYIGNEHNQLNTLVNCAGISVAYKTYNFTKKSSHLLEDFKKVLMVNTLGTFNVIRLVAGLMAQSCKDDSIFKQTIETVDLSTVTTNLPSVQPTINLQNIVRNMHFSSHCRDYYDPSKYTSPFPNIRTINLEKLKPRIKTKPSANTFSISETYNTTSTMENNDKFNMAEKEQLFTETLFEDEECQVSEKNDELTHLELDYVQESTQSSPRTTIIGPPLNQPQRQMSSLSCEHALRNTDIVRNVSSKSNSNGLPTSSVIIMTSAACTLDDNGQSGQVAFSASKAAVNGMTIPLARDFATQGIRVCTIAPGLMKTPLTEALPPKVRGFLAETIPYPTRLGLPEEYAKLALHIVENDYLNGAILRLDGAWRPFL